MIAPSRYCPLCDGETALVRCPRDDAPTVPRELAVAGRVPIGSVIAAAYRVVRQLGKGGMGEIYEAIDLAIDRPVAVKVLRAELIGDVAALRRFYREARIAGGIEGRHVVRVFGFGVDEATGMPFLVMELHQGRTLRQILADGPLAPAEAAQVITQVAHALRAAEARGVVHRDLKPENVFVDRTPGGELEIKVADFGIATMIGDHRLTATGELLGTPAYMAPEQIRGGVVDSRTDLYALGCVLHELVTGEPPFTTGALGRHLIEPVPALPTAAGEVLGRVHRALLAKDPAARPASAAAVLAMLGEVDASVDVRPPAVDALAAPTVRGEAPERRRSRRLLVALAALAAIAIGSCRWWTATRASRPRSAAIGSPVDSLPAPAPALPALVSASPAASIAAPTTAPPLAVPSLADPPRAAPTAASSERGVRRRKTPTSPPPAESAAPSQPPVPPVVDESDPGRAGSPPHREQP